MRKVKIGETDVWLYDGAEDMPMKVYRAFNHALFIDAAIGSDYKDHLHRNQRIAAFARQGDADGVDGELANQEALIYQIVQGINPKHNAFAALVHRIDGIDQLPGLDNQGLTERADLLSDLGGTHRQADGISESVKKKVQTELSVLFPRVFKTGENMEVAALLRRQSLLMLGLIVEDKYVDDDPDLVATTDELLTLNAPLSFQGEQSAEPRWLTTFEGNAIQVAKFTGMEPNEMSVLRFYQAVEMLRRQNEPTPKPSRRG